jgi:hypothetical protein
MALRFPYRTQRGSITLLLMLFLLAVLGFAGLRLLEHPSNMELSQSQAQLRLQMARDRVVQHLMEQSPEFGRLSDYPDVRGADGNYDGMAQTGCLYADYVNGNPLQNFALQGANLRCLGRLPWRQWGVDGLGGSEADLAGQVPWLAVSNQLIAPNNCVLNRTPLIVAEAYERPAACPATVPAALPMPWITLHDSLGRLSSNQIAFLLVLPGRSLGVQSREEIVPLPALPVGVNEMSPYLDSLTVNTTNPDANPGTFDNADQLLLTQPMRFIAGLVQTEGGDRLATYNQPMVFNDRVLAVSADQLFGLMEKRAYEILSRALTLYRQVNGHYPWAATLGTGTLGDTTTLNPVLNQRWGWAPYNELVTFLNARDTALRQSLERIAAAGWLHYFYYAVGQQCTPSSPGCAGGIVLDGHPQAVNAVLISPGRAIVAAPFAASKSAPQDRLLAANALSADWRDYLDGAAAVTDPAAGQYPSPGATHSANYNDRVYPLP